MDHHWGLILTLEYGANYSKPGGDVLRADRATLSATDPALSNFLHPILRLYDWSQSAVPLQVLHLAEDFRTEFLHPVRHQNPLRMFLNSVLDGHCGCTLPSKLSLFSTNRAEGQL